MPGMAYTVSAFGNFHFPHVRKFPAINLGVTRSNRDEGLQFSQLMDSESRLHIRKVVLEAGIFHLVIPSALGAITLPGIPIHSVKRHAPHLMVQRPAWGGDHSAFARRHVLRRVKAENSRVADVIGGR